MEQAVIRIYDDYSKENGILGLNVYEQNMLHYERKTQKILKYNREQALKIVTEYQEGELIHCYGLLEQMKESIEQCNERGYSRYDVDQILFKLQFLIEMSKDYHQYLNEIGYKIDYDEVLKRIQKRSFSYMNYLPICEWRHLSRFYIYESHQTMLEYHNNEFSCGYIGCASKRDPYENCPTRYNHFKENHIPSTDGFVKDWACRVFRIREFSFGHGSYPSDCSTLKMGQLHTI